jgi:mono/diheme cytochrome c family protein
MRIHGINMSLAFLAFAALPMLAWAAPQELKIEGDLPVPQTAFPAKPVRSAGWKIFDKWCSGCHGTEQGPGSMALQRKYKGTLPSVLEQRNNLPPEYISYTVRHGISFMPSFRKTEISDEDLVLLSAYLARPE